MTDDSTNFDLNNDQYRAMEGVVLVDVREADEWAAGHIPGAIHIALSGLTAGIAHSLDSTQTIVLYCGAGIRSRTAAAILAQQGFTKLHHLTKGIMGWDGEITRF